MEQPAISMLDSNCIMTIATVRPDGWPQATIVGYANDGFRLYFLVYRASQKFANIARNDRVAFTVAHEPAQLRDVQAVYDGCRVHEVTNPAERRRAWELLTKRHPNLTDLAPPENAEVATMAADCQHMSVLDYRQGLGHTESLTLGDTRVSAEADEGLASQRIASVSQPRRFAVRNTGSVASK